MPEAFDFVVPILNLICLGLMIAAAATSFAISSSNDTAYGLIYSCTGSQCSSAPFSCTSRQNTRQADAAVTVAACVAMGLAVVLSVSRMCNRKYFHNPRAKFVMFSTLFVIVLGAIFSMAAFILGFILFSVSFCEVKFSDFDSLKIGPHAPCALVACVLALVCAVFEFGIELLARHGSDE